MNCSRSHRLDRPTRQYRHRPQASWNGTVTRSPSATPRTSLPVATTVPPSSCPRTSGRSGVIPTQPQSPFQTCQSVRQIPSASISTITSSGAGAGSGSSTISSGARCFTRRAAFTISLCGTREDISLAAIDKRPALYLATLASDSERPDPYANHNLWGDRASRFRDASPIHLSRDRRPANRKGPGVTMDVSVEGTATPTPPSAVAVETRSFDDAPTTERHGKVWHLGPLWFAGNAQLATIATGTFGAALGLGFGWSLLAILVGAGIGTLFMAFHSTQGPKLGLPQMIQSRPQFGYYGALLPVVVAVLLFIGFNVFNTQLAETTAVQTLSVNPTTGAIIMAVLSYAFAIFGYRLIHVFCQWASVLFIVVYVLFGIGLA